MFKRVVYYGLLAGLVLCLPMFGPYFVFGLRPEWMKVSELVGYSAMLLCLSATFFAMRAERQRGAAPGFSRLLGVGVGVSMVAGLLFGLATWVFYTLVGNQLPEALFEFYALQIRDSGASAEEIARRLREMEAMRPLLYNRPLQGAVMAATVFVIGVVESVPGAWWLARRRGA
jgi:hypothetical protein